MNRLRSLLPQLERVCYLNYAATGPLLSVGAEKMAQLALQAKEPLQFHRDEWLSILEQARRTVAELIGASAHEIAFTTGTSSGLSLIANSIRWHAGDRILYASDEFPSNRFVWQNLKDREVESIAIPGDSFLAGIARMDLAKIRLVAVSAVSYWDGRRHEIEAIARFCKSRGILLVVDAVQAVGAIPVDVKKWGCDFLVSGGQKWLLGPVGTGFVYIDQRRLADLFVSQVGWASVKNLVDFETTSFEFADGARRFEPGLPDIPAIAALAASIEEMKRIGWNQIYRRIEDLASAACSHLKAAPHERAGIVAVFTPDAGEIQKKLRERKIIATQVKNRLRISMHASVQDDELAVFLETYLDNKKQIIISPRPLPSAAMKSAQRAVVVGASQGLGAAIAAALAKRGYHLLLCSRQMDKLEILAKSIREQYGVQAKAVSLDLVNGSCDDVKNMDLIVNCAASAGTALFEECNLMNARRHFEVNFWGPVSLVQQAISSMRKRGRGAILNIVTEGARCALPLFSIYAASKGAFWSWSEALQRELAATGIQVTIFIPPHMDSALSQQLARSAAGFYLLPKRMEKKADPDEVAEMALQALERKKTVAMPWTVRLKLALNVLFPSLITRKILKTIRK